MNAVSPSTSPSRYSQRDIDTGNTPLDEEMEMLIDPDIGRERVSTNPDVLDLDNSWRVEGEEPDFMDDPGTTDMIESVEEAEPWFPPTDPPLGRGSGNPVSVRGGSQVPRCRKMTLRGRSPSRAGRRRRDSRARPVSFSKSTATPPTSTSTWKWWTVWYSLHGQVTSLEDIDQAEQVAGNVEGVEEVEEDLEIV